MTDDGQPICPICGMPVDPVEDVYEIRLDGSVCHELCLKSDGKPKISEEPETEETPETTPVSDDNAIDDTEPAEEPETPSEPTEDTEDSESEETGPRDDGSEPVIIDLTSGETPEVVSEPVEEPETPSEPTETPDDGESVGKRTRRFGRKIADKTDKKVEERLADPDSFVESLKRWWKLHHGYVILRTLSRDDNSGDFLLETDICKKSDLPKGAVQCTGERGVWCLDTIKTSRWYLESRYNPNVSYYEAQFKASDAALYMESNIIDNALSIKWTDFSHIDWKKIILPIAAGLCILAFFIMRGGHL